MNLVDVFRLASNAPEQQNAVLELARRNIKTVQDVADGVSETAALMITASAAEVVSGFAGLGAGAVTGDSEKAANAVKVVQELMTYQPKTEGGQKAMQALGESIVGQFGEILTDASQKAGDFAYNKTGSEALAALAYSAPTLALEAGVLKPFTKAGKAAVKAGMHTPRIFAGALSKTADLKKMDAAKELAKRGVSRDEIWQKTGWFDDVDGNWKYEIDDSRYFHGTADDIKEIDASRFGDATDSFSAKQGFWRSSSPGTAESYANFAARDAKIQKMVRQADAAGDAGDWDKYDELINKAEALERESAAFKGQNIMPSYATGKIKEIDMKGADFMDEQDFINKEIMKAKGEGYDSLKLKRLVDDAGLVGKESDHIVTFNKDTIVSQFDEGLFEQPLARMNMTPEERASTPPWKTLDVPEDELIVRRGDGVAMSEGQDIKKLQAALSKKYKGASISLMDSGGDIELSKIVLDKADRGKGTGGAIMRDIEQFADANKMRLVLDPSPDFGGNVSRLKKFYKKSGFVENKGKNKSYEVSRSMYREPQ